MDPDRTDFQRIERDAKNWLSDIGRDLLQGEEIDLAELELSESDQRVRVLEVVDVRDVRIQTTPQGTPGEERVHLAAQVRLTCEAVEDETVVGDAPEAPDELTLRIDFELSLYDGEIAADPEFEILSISPSDESIRARR